MDYFFPYRDATREEVIGDDGPHRQVARGGRAPRKGTMQTEVLPTARLAGHDNSFPSGFARSVPYACLFIRISQHDDDGYGLPTNATGMRRGPPSRNRHEIHPLACPAEPPAAAFRGSAEIVRSQNVQLGPLQ